jgi:hypothetical protein
MILIAETRSVNLTGRDESFDISTVISGRSLVTTALTKAGRRFLRREFGAITATVAVDISPLDLATRCESFGIKADFDPFLDDWSEIDD